MRLILLLLSFSIIFSTCTKKEESPPFVSYLRMDINGTHVENDTYIVASRSSSPPHLLSVAASLKPHDANNAIEWEVYDFMEAPGEYIIPMSGGTLRTLVLYQKEATFSAKSGKITILEVNKDFIKGTFEFTTNQQVGIQKVITNGEFHIKRSL